MVFFVHTYTIPLCLLPLVSSIQATLEVQLAESLYRVKVYHSLLMTTLLLALKANLRATIYFLWQDRIAYHQTLCDILKMSKNYKSCKQQDTIGPVPPYITYQRFHP